ncbi:aldose epimerase family protein [Salinicoccus roseus]|uniref:aldose epimerase family protein n=1 Tax=Salinicoccus roseus TaxID=45670 RepID=UPI000F4F29BC|nr:aldose epimerase family protein [Salinicoccus roseus]RPE52858.1 aldose 1-epimerase [Salinicoccus roseus]GGA72853.1 aldose 1-epimerase [Salinicoccus roseus]
MKINRKNHEDGIVEYVLENSTGMKVELLNIGASITGIHVPDRNGNLTNVVLRNDSLEEYRGNLHFLGATIAPVAGRVKDAEIEVDGEKHHFDSNDGPHLLHSGDAGVHTKMWEDAVVEEDGTQKVKFTTSIEDYPGTPEVSILYSLDEDNALKLEYEVKSMGPTAVAPTNHVYFNLNSDTETTIGNHFVRSGASRYLKMDDTLIPESIETCEGIFDLQEGKALQEVFENGDAQIKVANGGYDHYFLLEDEDHFEVYEPESGRKVTITTDFPGLVFYTGNNLDDGLPLAERKPQKYMGFCMEAQVTPAAQHMDLEFEMESQGMYKKETVFRFSVEK